MAKFVENEEPRYFPPSHRMFDHLQNVAKGYNFILPKELSTWWEYLSFLSLIDCTEKWGEYLDNYHRKHRGEMFSDERMEVFKVLAKQLEEWHGTYRYPDKMLEQFLLVTTEFEKFWLAQRVQIIPQKGK